MGIHWASPGPRRPDSETPECSWPAGALGARVCPRGDSLDTRTLLVSVSRFSAWAAIAPPRGNRRSWACRRDAVGSALSSVGAARPFRAPRVGDQHSPTETESRQLAVLDGAGHRADVYAEAT